MNYLTIDLPSKCLLYGVQPQDVTCRSLKGKDEMMIAEMSVDNFDKKFLTLLGNVLKGVDPKKLTLGDKLYIQLWLVVNSYSREFPFDIECEKCWETFQTNVDLVAIDSVSLPETYKEPYEVKLPDCGSTIQLRLLRYEDLLKLNGNENTWLKQFALSIIDDKSNIIEKEMFLENLSVRDMMVIRAFHEKFTHGPVMKVKYECPNCGSVGVVPFPFRLEMLLPFGERLKNLVGDSI